MLEHGIITSGNSANESLKKYRPRRLFFDLTIGAETPEEIAVSIVAGLIAHRAGAAA